MYAGQQTSLKKKKKKTNRHQRNDKAGKSGRTCPNQMTATCAQQQSSFVKETVITQIKMHVYQLKQKFGRI